MAKGNTAQEALGELARQGYKGKAIVHLTKDGWVAQRLPKIKNVVVSKRVRYVTRLFGEIATYMKKFSSIARARGDFRHGDILKFVNHNMTVAVSGFSFPRFKLNSYDPPEPPKVVKCRLDKENKIHARIGVERFPDIFRQRAVRLFFKLEYHGAGADWRLAQVAHIDVNIKGYFELEFVVEGMAVGAWQWGVEYVRFSQTSGGVLHIRADSVGAPDAQTTLARSEPSAEYRLPLPEKRLGIRGRKILAKARKYNREKVRRASRRSKKL